MRNTDPLIEHYERMCRMRAFEEACIAGSAAKDIHGELHAGIGQEAVASGMAPHLRRTDAVVSTHRNHLHALAKGVSSRELMAEIFEKETGLCRGRGGHMHPFDAASNFSATGIVGASLPVALGYAYAFAMEGRGDVAVGVTGDGGANHGTFAECLNMAGAWTLPLVLLVENNAYAISVPASTVTAPPGISARAAAFGALGLTVDGVDVEAVDRVFGEAVAHARAGRGPVVVEAFCHRFRGHYEGDADSYRSRDERQRMRREADPILRARAALEARGVEAVDLDRLKREADDAAAVMLAAVRADPMPPAAGVMDFLFADAGAEAAA